MLFRIGLGVTLLLHIFIAWRLGRTFASRRRRVAFRSLLTALYIIFVLPPASWSGLVRLELTEAQMVYLLWPSYVAMGFYSLLSTLWLVRELGWLVALVLHRLGGRAPRGSIQVLPEDPARRTALAHALNLSVLGGSGALAGFGAYEARRRADVREVRVPISDLPASLEGFSIVQLSDVHVGPTIREDYLTPIIEAANALEPDLIAITGDLVDGSVPFLTEAIAPIGALRARHGVLFCTGNHEYYVGADAWIEHLRALGVRVLLNEHTVLAHDGGRVLVGGCTDEFGALVDPAHRQDIEACNDRGVAADVRVLLSHRPGTIFDAAAQGFDLQLSGHTHGGQFIPWNLVVKWVHPFSAGLDRFEKTWIYVNRGTGYFGPPVRLGAPSEITHLRLVRA